MEDHHVPSRFAVLEWPPCRRAFRKYTIAAIYTTRFRKERSIMFCSKAYSRSFQVRVIEAFQSMLHVYVETYS